MLDAEPPRRQPRWLRVAIQIGLALAAAEVALRVLFGLGRPVLMHNHPTIEYLAAPNQKLRRFGRRIEYNAYGMRSAPITPKKSDPHELRLLMVGDSVINCGAMLDQSELASTLLANSLPKKLKRPVAVANVSAGSWGPQNELAYLNEFGLFDADLAVVVVSTHDLKDVPTFRPLSARETSNPRSALGEAVTRYLVPFVVAELHPAPQVIPSSDATPAFEALLEKLENAHLTTLVLYHSTQPELARTPTTIDEFMKVQDLAHRHGAIFIPLGGKFLASEREGLSPYRTGDPIHTSSRGQEIIAETIESFVLQHQASP
jgi:hypothetical protein